MTDMNENSKNCIYCATTFADVYDLIDHLKLNHSTELNEFLSCKNLPNFHEKMKKSDKNLDVKLNGNDKLEMAKYEAYLMSEGKTDSLDNELTEVCKANVNTIKMVRETKLYKDMVANCMKEGVQHEDIKFIDKDATIQCPICNQMMKNKGGLLYHTRIRHRLAGFKITPHCIWTEEEVREFAAKEANIFTKTGERPPASVLKKEFKKEASEIDSIRFRDPYLGILKMELINRKTEFVAKELEKYHCVECDKVFDKYAFYYSHYREKHAAAGENTDSVEETALRVSKIDFVIPKSFFDEINLYVPTSENKENNTYVPCNICHKHYSNPIQLRRHILRMHDKPQQAMEVPEVEELREVQEVQEQPLICKNCNKSFRKTSKYVKHTNKCVVEETTAVSQSYNCKYCSETFEKQKKLKKHVEANHALQIKNENAPKDVFNCDDCKTTYLSLECYEKHIETDHVPVEAENKTAKKSKKNKRKLKTVDDNAEPDSKKKKA